MAGFQVIMYGRFWVFTEDASASHPPIIQDLALPPGDKIYSVLVLGYPKIRFYRTVDRKPLQVSWAE